MSVMASSYVDNLCFIYHISGWVFTSWSLSIRFVFRFLFTAQFCIFQLSLVKYVWPHTLRPRKWPRNWSHNYSQLKARQQCGQLHLTECPTLQLTISNRTSHTRITANFPSSMCLLSHNVRRLDCRRNMANQCVSLCILTFLWGLQDIAIIKATLRSILIDKT